MLTARIFGTGNGQPYFNIPTPDIAFTDTVSVCRNDHFSFPVTANVFGLGPDILVPTGFTPNGDGKNDVLQPILVGMGKLEFFTVYDRFGRVVFTTSEEGRGWDGSHNGSPQEGGSYVFVARGVDYLGKVVLKKGTAVLIR